jgi:hypothetical protein
VRKPVQIEFDIVDEDLVFRFLGDGQTTNIAVPLPSPQKLRDMAAQFTYLAQVADKKKRR